MKFILKLSILCVAVFTNLTGYALDYTGKYIESETPGMEARLFAPNLISTQYVERDAAFSPDGNSFFYSFYTRIRSSILYVELVNGSWTKPEIAPFSGLYNDIEPFFTADGKRLYFASNRPLEGVGDPKDYDIWYVDKTPTGWGLPVNIGAPVNTDKDEFYPTLTKDGTLYLTASYDSTLGGEDLFFSRLIDGKYSQPQNLGANVNTAEGEYNAFVSPDGDYIIFTSEGWGEGIGSGDLWISFRDHKNEWQKPVNMGEAVNSPSFEYCPSLTPDGKFLFFTSMRSNQDHLTPGKKITYQTIIETLSQPGNGNGDIYWIDSKIIDSLRPKK